METLLITLARHQNLCPAMQPGFALCFPGRLSSGLASLGRAPTMLGAVRIRQPWTVVRARRALFRMLRPRKADVVVFHAPWAYALFGGVIRRLRLPSVVWLHGPLRHRHWLDRLATRVAPSLAVCNSRFTEQSLDAFQRRPDSVVLHPPVTMSPDGPDDRTSARDALGVPEGTVVMIQVGRLDPMKGNREHLEALALLRDIPGWVSWHVGGAQSEAQARHLQDLQAVARAHGVDDRVRFFGERPDVARLLQAADIYVQPNTSPDGFGLSFVEAMLGGLPVVTSGCGGALEVVDRSCGVLVPPGDVATLAASLNDLIVNPGRRLALGAAGPARARMLCDPARQLAALETVLTTVARASAPATGQAVVVDEP